MPQSQWLLHSNCWFCWDNKSLSIQDISSTESLSGFKPLNPFPDGPAPMLNDVPPCPSISTSRPGSCSGPFRPHIPDTQFSNERNNFYHDEGQARYTAAEPPTATVVESLGVPVHSLPAEAAGSLVAAWTALPDPPPPTATTRYGSSPPPLNPSDKYCRFSKTAGPCYFTVDRRLKTPVYKHIVHCHIADELRSLDERTLRVQDAQILTTQDRVRRAQSHVWRCPAQDCGYWSMDKHSVIRHVIDMTTGHEEVGPRNILQPAGIGSSKATLRAILGDDGHGEIEGET
ncbi:hypothetical protein JB92DRAFT_3122372 [Gautieria morchelliformis]|nr:hypothetical protein JB92DRAFT_3122372 [Gautieria morchelliformis]